MDRDGVVFLDDMFERHKAFRDLTPDGVKVWHVHTAAEAISEIDRRKPFQVFLDHDLSDEDIMIEPGAQSKVPTGMTVVDHIMTMDEPPMDIIIHSCNGPAAMAMLLKLEEHPAKPRVRAVPFPELIFRMQVAYGR